FSYGFGFVLFQSFSITFHEMGSRLIAISYSSFLTFIALIIFFLITKKETGYSFNINILNPFYHLKEKIRLFITTLKKSFYNLLFILRIHLFTYDRLNIDATSFDLRKTRFALRIALLITFTFFLERIFNIPKGYWLPLNVFIMTLPFYEDSVIKIRERLIGNVAGVFVSALLLHFLKGYTWHMIILSVATFFAYAVNNYAFRSGYMTCYAIALSTLFMKESEIFELRLAYVFLAAIISIIGSRFIFVNKKE
ncbi:MAG: FUSC family protein, partial [Eubacterium sp.]